MNDEWFTPKPVIKIVKEVFDGRIDLDPCSCEFANERIGAVKYYTKDDNCLDDNISWNGKVFVNPPYSNPLLRKILKRAVSEYKSGNILELLILTNSGTDTLWNQALKDGLQAYTIGRIRFINSDGNQAGLPGRGQVFTYYGSNKDRFIEVFSRNNFCWFPNLNK